MFIKRPRMTFVITSAMPVQFPTKSYFSIENVIELKVQC